MTLGYASPRDAPTTADYDATRQGNHLAGPKRCIDEPGHLNTPIWKAT